MGYEEIFEFNVPPTNLALSWFNSYSGVIIKTPRAILIFDPVKVRLEECIRADAIIITHEHIDHFDPKLVKELQRKTKAPILTTPFVAANLPHDNIKTLRVGDYVVIKDIELHASRCDHPANEPLSFIISTQSGINVYHPSDSEAFPEMVEIANKFKPDVLLYVGASLVNAAQIANLAHPKVVISFYTDIRSEEKFIEVLKRDAPESQTKLIKRFEVYQYPEDSV
ncbi:MAG: MBL fold metallo-hydrolase [Chloroflexota bacterium]|nr:MBL fold metallo-hydrolase [Chloroflexota bacterium]